MQPLYKDEFFVLFSGVDELSTIFFFHYSIIMPDFEIKKNLVSPRVFFRQVGNRFDLK